MRLSSIVVYPIKSCGAVSPRWVGKCPGCEAWNTLQEVRDEAGAGASAHRFAALAGTQPVATLSEIVAAEVPRTPTGQDELDRALGGGIVPGGVVLIGGDPGIGKSTLLLQAADSLSRTLAPGRPQAGDTPSGGGPTTGGPGGLWTKVLYITGEESGAQVALRARRLGLDGQRVRVLAEISLERILAALQAEAPAFCVIDSIQTLYSPALTSALTSALVRGCQPGALRSPSESEAQSVSARAKRVKVGRPRQTRATAQSTSSTATSPTTMAMPIHTGRSRSSVDSRPGVAVAGVSMVVMVDRSRTPCHRGGRLRGW